MALSPETLDATLDACRDRHGAPGRLLVACSGGPDSSALLHLAAACGRSNIVAAHVNHGLHADADAWEEHCRRQAAALDVSFLSCRVEVASRGGDGLEANARAARYAALEGLMQPGDWLLTAHHRDDQAETLLLNLMRGSGPDGLRGIARERPFGPGWLLRPLLDVSRRELADYVAAAGLECIRDPGNDDCRQDRNFLRAEVLPLIESRWPAARRQLARSAGIARDTAAQLAEQADTDIAACGEPARLDLDDMALLSRPRQLNLLRRAARRLGLPLPPSAPLTAMLDELAPARADGSPRIAWNGGEARRHRRRLYLMATLPERPEPPAVTLRPGTDVDGGPGLGRLTLEEGTPGLPAALVGAGLRIAFRAGGEAFRPAGQAHRRTLKKLLREAGIVPWMRERLPLLYAGDELVAVADLWIAAEHAVNDGYRVAWQGRPALF